HTPRPGEYGVGPAQPRIAGLGHEFTGESVAQGKTPVDITASLSDRATRVNRLLQTEQTYETLWKVASPVRRSSYDLPIRSTREIKADLKSLFARMADHLHPSPDEAMRVDATELRQLTDKLEANEAAGAGVGARVQGVRWVDSRYLKDLGET